jgi:repressor LexA
MYETFKKLLDERNITAYQVSKDTGISQVVFSEWKKSKSKPKVDKLSILAKYFGVPLEDFIEVKEG